MPNKKLTKFLLLEILTIFIVGSLFAILTSHFMAGMIAGTLFCALGIYLCRSCLEKKNIKFKFTFWAAFLHLLISVTMLSTRIINSNMDFKDVSYLGLPGPIFHHIATGIYGVLIVATLVDFFISRKSSFILK